MAGGFNGPANFYSPYRRRNTSLPYFCYANRWADTKFWFFHRDKQDFWSNPNDMPKQVEHVERKQATGIWLFQVQSSIFSFAICCLFTGFCQTMPQGLVRLSLIYFPWPKFGQLLSSDGSWIKGKEPYGNLGRRLEFINQTQCPSCPKYGIDRIVLKKASCNAKWIEKNENACWVIIDELCFPILGLL